MLKVNGMNVFPAEIESILVEHPLVTAAAVVGRPDPKKGECPVGFVVVDDPREHARVRGELLDRCREKLSIYKQPEIMLLTEFPLTPTGKVRKNELVKLYVETAADTIDIASI